MTINKATYLIIKRLFDIICALIGILFLIPIALVVYLSYIISGDFHCIIYSHNRVGKNGKIFKLYKFRSMVNNSDSIFKELMKDSKYKKEWIKYHKLKNDPRITKIGKVLRETSLDELPQVINVLKGEMSFIGPRPLAINELDSHRGKHKLYESVIPGISGWWATHGRSKTSFRQRLKLEYFYCRKCNLWIDIKCLILTIIVVIRRTGAK